MIGAIIGAAGGALSSVLGGISRNKQLREQQRMLEAKKKENDNWYDRRYNEDATQRADAQAILTQTREEMQNRNRAAAGTQSVMGGTEESVAATKAANAKAMADATSRIAVAGEARKDNIENQYMQRDNELDSRIAAVKSQKQSGLDIFGNALGGAASGFAAGLEVESSN